MDREQELFNAVPEHITSDLDVWSMCDFVDVQNSSMCRSIEELIEIGEQHVYKCVVSSIASKWDLKNSYIFFFF